jgi:hypothetical protein
MRNALSSKIRVCYNGHVSKFINIIFIMGFIAVDWLTFHDFLKSGEVYTLTEYLTGILSLIVIVTSLQSLLKR